MKSLSIVSQLLLYLFVAHLISMKLFIFFFIKKGGSEFNIHG